MARRQLAKFPCGVCGGECGVNTILCGACNKWHHSKCEVLTRAEFKFLSSNSTVDYVCAKCRTDDDGLWATWILYSILTSSSLTLKQPVVRPLDSSFHRLGRLVVFPLWTSHLAQGTGPRARSTVQERRWTTAPHQESHCFSIFAYCGRYVFCS